MDRELIEVVLDDFASKKIFNAKWKFDCNICGASVAESGEFYFFGGKEKMCPACKEKIENQLEQLLKESEDKENV